MRVTVTTTTVYSMFGCDIQHRYYVDGRKIDSSTYFRCYVSPIGYVYDHSKYYRISKKDKIIERSVSIYNKKEN